MRIKIKALSLDRNGHPLKEKSHDPGVFGDVDVFEDIEMAADMSMLRIKINGAYVCGLYTSDWMPAFIGLLEQGKMIQDAMRDAE